MLAEQTGAKNCVREVVPISVIIPTYARGLQVCGVIARVLGCRPAPAEILVHIDRSDGSLKAVLRKRFPEAVVLESPERRGPGGGRHQMLLACTQPYAVSFDDDSYPVDEDFFRSMYERFEVTPNTAVIATNIWHRPELPANGQMYLLPGDFQPRRVIFPFWLRAA